MVFSGIRSRRLTVVVAMVAAAAGAVLTAPAAGAERAVAADDFYVPPAELPAGKPGDVIRSRPSQVGWPSAQADAWQVMYLSSTALGKPTAMTGTVLVPKGVDAATAPIVAFGPGTQGPAFRCAPSKMIASGAFYEQTGLNDLTAAGFAVAIPDYEGYRPDPSTTYIAGKAMGAAMIDVVRAAQRLPEAKLADDGKVAFRGYSQGGGAAMWAGEMQPEYAPEMKLAGVAAGGVPADVVQVALQLNGGDGFGFLAEALIGLDNTYPDLKLADYLNDTGKQAFASIDQDACAFELLTQYKGKGIEEYTSQNPLLQPEWTEKYELNKLGGKPPKVPVFDYHATQDNLVQFGQGKTLRDTYCEKGVKVTWKTFETDHITGVYSGNKDVLAFLKDRFAGAAPTSNC